MQCIALKSAFTHERALASSSTLGDDVSHCVRDCRSASGAGIKYVLGGTSLRVEPSRARRAANGRMRSEDTRGCGLQQSIARTYLTSDVIRMPGAVARRAEVYA